MHSRGPQVSPDLVDRMIDLYCDWRTACAEVQAAYELFLDASAPDRAVAFAAYTAALDREQSACESYAEQIQLIESRYAGEELRARRPGMPDRGR